ncbi:MAG: hypothetical protein LBP51_00210 [Deferribacteraceae bacterium]|jgi:hypothetical protein|nr:hypothetical protein [Deferribacteraceae bacterium]
MRLIQILFIFVATLSSFELFGGEVAFTGKARIIKDNVRSAMEASRVNALLGGVGKYMRSVIPNNDVTITEEYLMFVDNYTIEARWLSGSTVYTTLKINVNDLISEEIAVYSAKQLNTAVFLFSGLPDYVPDGEVRRLIMGVLERNQFSTSYQPAFEREVIDPQSRLDIQAALQAVTGAQYMFNFKFNLTDYAAGEFCRLQIDTTYISSKNLDVVVPILRTELKVEDNETKSCIAYSIETSLESVMQHLRKKLIPLPTRQLELVQYPIIFKNVTELRTINNIISTLVKRKVLAAANIEEFFDDEAVFSVETYLPPQELAKQVEKQKFDHIRRLNPIDNGLEISIGAPEVLPEEPLYEGE